MGVLVKDDGKTFLVSSFKIYLLPIKSGSTKNIIHPHKNYLCQDIKIKLTLI